jgi:hypothetical protein
MTDKERIFTRIITMTSANGYFPISENTVKWEYIDSNTILEKGDIVCGKTNPNHNYGISFFVEKTSIDELVVQEIGTTKQCNYSNEMFMVLRNFPDYLKLCGDEYLFYLKLNKVLSNYNIYRFYDIKFYDNKVEMFIRKKWSEDKFSVILEYKGRLSNVTQKKIKNTIGTEGY